MHRMSSRAWVAGGLYSRDRRSPTNYLIPPVDSFCRRLVLWIRVLALTAWNRRNLRTLSVSSGVALRLLNTKANAPLGSAEQLDYRAFAGPDAPKEINVRKIRNNEGFTLIELLIVVAIIGIIAAIAVPGLLRARQSGNEASAIGSVRAINSAEATYAASCGGGGYAITVAALAKAPTSGVAFISPDLAGGTKSGYKVVVADGPAGATVLAAASTCNGAATASSTQYYAHVEPSTPGTTGQRSFASNETGTIYQKNDGSAIANDMSDGTILQ